jgi:lipopolysaccharide export LptBFGC system permease protein LptF
MISPYAVLQNIGPRGALLALYSMVKDTTCSLFETVGLKLQEAANNNFLDTYTAANNAFVASKHAYRLSLEHVNRFVRKADDQARKHGAFNWYNVPRRLVGAFVRALDSVRGSAYAPALG